MTHNVLKKNTATTGYLSRDDGIFLKNLVSSGLWPQYPERTGLELNKHIGIHLNFLEGYRYNGIFDRVNRVICHRLYRRPQ